MASTVNPRPYDSTNRRKQAAQTQLRIFDAAQRLFLRDGYTATTMKAIADEAGVAIQTVYASARSKRDILKGILDVAVSGPDEQVAVSTSSQWQEIEQQADPTRRLELFARLHVEICVREAPAFAIMADAAGSDTEIRALQQKTAQLRYQDQHNLARLLRAHLRPGLTIRRAADIIWTLASERTYLALVHERGWPVRAYQDWLVEQLTTVLEPPRSG